MEIFKDILAVRFSLGKALLQTIMVIQHNISCFCQQIDCVAYTHVHEYGLGDTEGKIMICFATGQRTESQNGVTKREVLIINILLFPDMLFFFHFLVFLFYF